MPPYYPKTICEQILLVTIPLTDPRVNSFAVHPTCPVVV